jgi:hypothetical protein
MSDIHFSMSELLKGMSLTDDQMKDVCAYIERCRNNPDARICIENKTDTKEKTDIENKTDTKEKTDIENKTDTKEKTDIENKTDTKEKTDIENKTDTEAIRKPSWGSYENTPITSCNNSDVDDSQNISNVFESEQKYSIEEDRSEISSIEYETNGRHCNYGINCINFFCRYIHPPNRNKLCYNNYETCRCNGIHEPCLNGDECDDIECEKFHKRGNICDEGIDCYDFYCKKNHPNEHPGFCREFYINCECEKIHKPCYNYNDCDKFRCLFEHSYNHPGFCYNPFNLCDENCEKIHKPCNFGNKCNNRSCVYEHPSDKMV